jgi:hypothetical protein
MAVVLVWTAMEILFDLSAEREKTKTICGALSAYVEAHPIDRDRAYQVIRDLYYKRGRTVHAGREIDPEDAVQSFQLAKAVFQRVLIDGKLPHSRRETLH